MAERAGLLHASGVAAAQPREPGCPRRRWARRTRVGPGVPWGTLATLAESRWPQQALPDMSEKSEGSLKSGSPRAPPLPRDALGEPSAALRVSSAREGGRWARRGGGASTLGVPRAGSPRPLHGSLGVWSLTLAPPRAWQTTSRSWRAPPCPCCLPPPPPAAGCRRRSSCGRRPSSTASASSSRVTGVSPRVPSPLPQGRASAARRRPGPRSCFSPEGFSFSGLSPRGLSTGQKPSLGSGGLCPPASVPSPVLPGGSSLPSPPPPPVAGLPPPSGASRAQRAVSSCCPDAGAETGDSLSSPRSPEEGRRRPAEGRKCRAGRRGRRAARGSPAPPERGLCARSAWWRPCWCWTCSAGRTPPSCTAPSPA